MTKKKINPFYTIFFKFRKNVFITKKITFKNYYLKYNKSNIQ